MRPPPIPWNPITVHRLPTLPAGVRRSLLSLACGAALAPTGLPVVAQTAGMELQGPVPTRPLPAPADALPRIPDLPASAPAAANAAAPTVELRGVRFEGNASLPTAELIAHLGPLDGIRFDVPGLAALADRVTRLYRARGFPLAQAQVPPQRIADGVLLIRVVEGRFGRSTATGDDPKVPGAQPFLAAGVPPGAAVRTATLERTMLLLDDQPGFRVRPLLRPGSAFGETDLEVEVVRRNRVSGEVGLDNAGNAGTGTNRLRASVAVNSPWRFGDRLSMTAMVTDENLWLGSVEYEAPVDATGTRAAVGVSRSSYQLGGAFSSLDASGVADTLSLRVSRAIVRSQRVNLLGSVTVARKDLRQRFATVDLERHRRADVLTLALQHDRRDGVGGGGVTYGQASVSAGRLTLDDGSRAVDEVTARTEGGFSKLALDVARIQRVAGPVTAYGRLSLQWTSGNLDPSEKFGVGGHLGVRAYPLGEASGDRGWLAQTELRLAAAAGTTVFVWADAGRAELNAKPWDTASAARRSIAGAGPGVRWTHDRWTVDSTLGWRVRGGPAQAEARDRDPRFYLVGSYRFD